MTQTTEIVVRYVNDPPGKGPGTVKDDQNRLWKVWPDKLDLFRGCEGQRFFIGYQTAMYQGRRQATIVSANPMDNNAPSRPNVTPQHRGYSEDTPSPRRAQNGPAPFSDERSEDISVLALVKSWMDKIPVGDVATAVHALRSCREAWRQYKRNPAAPESFPGDDPAPEESASGDFDDSIPY